jgi:hypothetical protein
MRLRRRPAQRREVRVDRAVNRPTMGERQRQCGNVSVVAVPEKVSTMAPGPESKSTSPVKDVSTGFVAGGAGGKLMTRQPHPVCWFSAVIVAVIAPNGNP